MFVKDVRDLALEVLRSHCAVKQEVKNEAPLQGCSRDKPCCDPNSSARVIKQSSEEMPWCCGQVWLMRWTTDNDVLVASLNPWRMPRWSNGLGLPRTIIIRVVTYHQSLSVSLTLACKLGKLSLINRVLWAKEAVRGHS